MSSKAFLDRIMVKNEKTTVDTGYNSHPVNKESLGPFERTTYKGAARVGAHPTQSRATDEDSFDNHVTTQRLNPREFQKSGSGLGGTANLAQALHIAQAKATSAKSKIPPKAGATSPRPNPPNTELRRFYERGDLPVIIVQGSKPRLNWKTPIDSLEYAHFLPIFASGLREVEEPYRFVAECGMRDMLQAGGEEKVLPVVPSLIVGLKEAFATRDEKVIVRTCTMLQDLARLGQRVGQALVPYYRQLLPVCSLLASRVTNLGDGMDYGQRRGHLGETIQETLQVLEQYGGPDAYINLRYVVPTYESASIS